MKNIKKNYRKQKQEYTQIIHTLTNVNKYIIHITLYGLVYA